MMIYIFNQGSFDDDLVAFLPASQITLSSLVKTYNITTSPLAI
jgi:hypothetical protein